MITTELQQEVKRYIPALTLDSIFPRALRLFLIKTIFITILVLLALELFLFLLTVASPILEPKGILLVFSSNTLRIHGLLLIAAAFGLVLLMLETFYNSLYFRGITVDSSHGRGKDERGITYEVGDILSKGYTDLTKTFCASRYGARVLLRCGVSREAYARFIQSRRILLTPKTITPPKKGFLSFQDLAFSVFAHDKAFADFLFGQGVSKEIFEGATKWIFRSLESGKEKSRWWSRDRLIGTESIGLDWAYGGAYELVRFAKELSRGSVFSALLGGNEYATEKVSQLETILARAQEANALLVGKQGVGKRDILIQLEHKIKNKDVLQPLTHKRVLSLDTNAFIAVYGDKQSFEVALLKLLSHASDAGNVILVIENITTFITNAEAFGSDIVVILDSYLASTELHVLATSDPVSFHEVIEARPQLMQRFEVVHIESPDLSSTIAVLQDVAEEYEQKKHMVFTYTAIETTVDSAERYIVGGVMPDKAVDLLIELLAVAEAEKTTLITKDFVHQYVKTKTGVSVGQVSGEERETLLNLEKILHRRVIGQDEAIDTISNAMRRARAGIQNPKRPLGSFLFLGPTGVGKTETTKALAEVIFHDEDKMLRLDMSEYGAADALERLIGSADREQVGDLVVMLKEHPHGVLLLDEFEKTTPDVMDLFLQVLDEGQFTSSRGEQISARNHIIIATSNAGSNLIWEFTKIGRKLSDAKEEIIDAIIKDGVYKPELINRFDSVVIFHTLSEEHLEAIAHLMLGRLKKRIKKQGYELVVNDVLVTILVTEGFNPQFGARPMRRVAQEKIEKLIAEKIIEGALKPGSSIEFTEEDFQ